MKRTLLALIILLLGVSGFAQNSRMSKLKNSHHDFSTASAASVKSTSSDALCLFCHTPHNAKPAAPLWNHTLTTGITYQVYQSTTLQSSVGQPLPADSSKLCLSCHDGTVALGDTVNDGQIPFQNVNAQGMLPTSNPGNLGGTNYDLQDDHPVAFTPDLSNNQLVKPPVGDPVKLDSQGRLQCTACHDPHNEYIDPVENRFLVKNNSGSAICTTCHTLKGGTGSNLWSWDGSTGLPSGHKIATNTYDTSTNDGGISWLGAHTGYTTTATNGCESCHRPHTAHNAERLMKGETDQTCFQCHDGNPATAQPNLQAEFTGKTYVHPSLGPQAGHDPDESPNNITTRHAACDDCHNAHATRADAIAVSAPQIPGSVLGDTGIAADGTPHDARRGTGDAQYEYEVCLKCHSYNSNKPQIPGYTGYGTLPNRQFLSTDIRQAITSAASWHPISSARGLSLTQVPSLLPGMVYNDRTTQIPGRTLSPSTQIYCIDCHSNDSGSNLGAGFTGPRGPHGSNIIHLLERNYTIEPVTGTPGITPNLPYSSSNYSLCFKCHSETSLQNNQSFQNHSDHMAVTSCATCHDPHGVPSGNAVNNSFLINFDLNVVAPNSSGQLVYQYTNGAPNPDSCQLKCHNADHTTSGVTVLGMRIVSSTFRR